MQKKISKINYLLLTGILLFAFFSRIYRVGELLGFHYDQGRDALVIWQFLKEGKLFLVGPVTGLAGIFLGPFYYYLITPFYLISGGNPVFPAVFLSLLSTLAILFLFLLGKKMHSSKAGLIAAFLGGFSYQIMFFSRWFSNPNPILLTSLTFFWSLWEIVNGKKKTNESKNLWSGRWWIVASLSIGLSLHFESASAVFYLPIFLIFSIWQIFSKKNVPNKRVMLIVFLTFFVTILPQLIFNFRHENILFNNFYDLLFKERSFKAVTGDIFQKRVIYFWNVFTNKLFLDDKKIAVFFVFPLMAYAFVKRREFKKDLFRLFAIFFTVPLIGFLFFQGNYGNIYDYYLSGFYLPSILFVGVVLGQMMKEKFWAIFVFIFLGVFFFLNIKPITAHLVNTIESNTDIYFKNQLEAVDWVFSNSTDLDEFNVDVYVPPVIPHSYDYLFLWQGTKLCGEGLCGMKLEENVETLYTLYEVDPPHPERLEAWLERQKGIGEIQEEVSFGGITVQRRTRLDDLVNQ